MSCILGCILGWLVVSWMKRRPVFCRAVKWVLCCAASPQDPPQPDDEALFLHTSGTTARPKVSALPAQLR